MIAIISKAAVGWGTWIRTKAFRVRVGSSTAKLSPKRFALASVTLQRRAVLLALGGAACNLRFAEFGN